MKKTLREKIIKDKKYQPNSPNFSKEKYLKLKDNLNHDELKIFEFGIEVYEILKSIRDNSKNNNKNEKQLISLLLASSNRNQYLIRKKTHNIENKKNITSLKINIFENENLTLDEASEGSTSGIEKAIYSLVSKKHTGTEDVTLEDVSNEQFMSSIYNTIESYWLSVIYTNFEVNIIDSKLVFHQPNDELERCIKSNHIRNQKLILNTHKESNHSPKKTIRYKKGKTETINTKRSKSNDSIDLFYSSLKNSISIYPKEKIYKESSHGFRIIDLLDVFAQLSNISNQALESFPNIENLENGNEFLSKEELENYSVILNKDNLARNLSEALSTPLKKIREILEFLTYDTKTFKDFWSHPILRINNAYHLNLGVLISPYPKRLIDRWSNELNLDNSEKGINYEKHCIKKINGALSSNDLLTNYDFATDLKAKINGTEEQIDLLFRIGNTIFLAECKSVVLSDSPQSEYNALKSLKEGCKQAERKSRFVSNNINEIVSRLNWKTEFKDLKVIPFLLNETKNITGYKFCETPISDELTLERVLFTPFHPLISSLENNKEKHHVIASLYNDQYELEKKLSYLISNPIHIHKHEDFFSYEESLLIPSSEKPPRNYSLKRLIPNRISPEEAIEIQSNYNIEIIKLSDLSKNYDAII